MVSCVFCSLEHTALDRARVLLLPSRVTKTSELPSRAGLPAILPTIRLGFAHYYTCTH